MFRRSRQNPTPVLAPIHEAGVLNWGAVGENVDRKLKIDLGKNPAGNTISARDLRHTLNVFGYESDVQDRIMGGFLRALFDETHAFNSVANPLESLNSRYSRQTGNYERRGVGVNAGYNEIGYLIDEVADSDPTVIAVEQDALINTAATHKALGGMALIVGMPEDQDFTLSLVVPDSVLANSGVRSAA